MRPRIQIKRKVLCATSALGDSRVKSLMDCPQIRRKTTDDHIKELKAKMQAVYSRKKYAIKYGRIFILTHKGGFAKNILY